jgi:hypothetical protein
MLFRRALVYLLFWEAYDEPSYHVYNMRYMTC